MSGHDGGDGNGKRSTAFFVDLAWKLIPVIVAITASWVVMKSAIVDLQKEKLDSVRFVADSITNSYRLRDIQSGVERANDGVDEANERLKEIQCGLPAKPGCR
jgi:hypothetical protein